MLTSKTVNAGVTEVLEALNQSDVDEAKKKIDEVSRDVKTERERGVLMAATGIATSMAKAKDGTLQSWDEAKIVRAAQAITRSQMSDEFDIGYAETLASYAKLLRAKE